MVAGNFRVVAWLALNGEFIDKLASGIAQPVGKFTGNENDPHWQLYNTKQFWPAYEQVTDSAESNIGYLDELSTSEIYRAFRLAVRKYQIAYEQAGGKDA